MKRITYIQKPRKENQEGQNDRTITVQLSQQRSCHFLLTFSHNLLKFSPKKDKQISGCSIRNRDSERTERSKEQSPAGEKSVPKNSPERSQSLTNTLIKLKPRGKAMMEQQREGDCGPTDGRE